MRALILAILVLSIPTVSLAQQGVFNCATNEVPVEQEIDPEQSLVKMRILFVSFPEADSTLTASIQSIESEIEDFVNTMSGELQSAEVEVVVRPAPHEEYAWVASELPTYYDTNGGPGALNTEMIVEVKDVLGASYWDSVDYVGIFHMECAWPTLPLFGCDCDGQNQIWTDEIDAAGMTLQLEANLSGSLESIMYGFMHEYGHSVQLVSHPPSPASPNQVNYGRYSLTVGTGGAVDLPEEGLIPYGTYHMARDNPWVPLPTVKDEDERNVRVPDVFSKSVEDREVFQVIVPGSQQTFFLANHQGSTMYDAKYLGTGLLIWHILREDDVEYGWDLELATGKIPNGETGEDSLEADPNYLGQASDFFDGVTHTDFNCASNPHTYLYTSDTNPNSPQTDPTSVAFENIRQEANGDMLVDIYLTPKQYLNSTTGGETVNRGDKILITWDQRLNACITGVDVEISSDSGVSYSLIQSNLPNTGSYEWHVLQPAGTTYRVRLKSYDSHEGIGYDESGSNITVLDPRVCS